MPTITVLGSINYDVVASAQRLPVMGESVDGVQVDFFVGGKGANQAVQAACLGATVRFIGCVGADTQGEIVRARLDAQGVDVEQLVVDKRLRTGCASIFVNAQGDNMLIYAPGANHHIAPARVDAAAETIRTADAFMTQNEINEDAILRGLSIAKEAGVTTILNPAPARPIAAALYPLIDYITPNETESESYTGIARAGRSLESWAQDNAAWFLERGVQNVCITLGGEGAFFSNESVSVFAEAFPIAAVDTTAAGDSFNGGFVYGLTAGLPLRSCLHLGCACGALSAMHLGAQNSIQNRAAVMSFLRERGVSL